MPVGCGSRAVGEDGGSFVGTSRLLGWQRAALCRGRPYLGTALRHQITYLEVEAFFKCNLKQNKPPKTTNQNHHPQKQTSGKAPIKKMTQDIARGHFQESFGEIQCQKARLLQEATAQRFPNLRAKVSKEH